jgi:photosystem II stability/assembly factor-like uncharacterized protein
MIRIIRLHFISIVLLLSTSCSEVVCPEDKVTENSLPLLTGKWTVLNTGVTANLRGVSFPKNGKIGYVCGMNGVMLKTTDAGLTFTQLNTGTTQHLYRVCFVNANTGYAIGDNYTVIKTTDGGASWSSNLVTTQNGKNFRSIQFFDENKGIIGATNGTLYRTTDGGLNWTTFTFAPWQYTAYSMNWTDFDHGYLGCNYGTLYKYDYGTVTDIPTLYNKSPTCAIWGMHSFSNVEKFFIASDNDWGNPLKRIAYTSDGVKLKNKYISALADTVHLQTIRFYNRATGLVVGGNFDNGKSIVLLSTDSGNTWQKQIVGKVPHLFDISFTSNSAILVGYGGSVLKSGQ